MSNSFEKFASDRGISMITELIDSRPDDADFPTKGSFHFKVTLRYGNRSMIVYYSMGPGYAVKVPFSKMTQKERTEFWKSKGCFPMDCKADFVMRPPTPKIGDVLESLQGDTSSSDEDFEFWASNYGYDLDSRKAERIYNLCKESARQLRNLMGMNVYQEFLNVDPNDE